jgi:tight adherence protein B
MNILLAIGLFIVVLLMVEAGYFGLRSIWKTEKQLVRRRLHSIAATSEEYEMIDLSRKSSFSQISWLNQILSRLRWTARVQRALEMANLPYPLGFFVLLSILLAALGYLAGSLKITNPLFLLPGAVLLGMTPFFYIFFKKGKRMHHFQRQLPDVLDLIARSLKAGHALSGGLKMVVDEFGDPIGIEFAKTLNEINLGVGVPEALKNLSQRVDCLDLNFFVTSILIQRETGGNLAEILENIARLIRERFKLFGRIRALSAEGKFSAIILVVLPFLIALVISFLNPGYIQILIVDPIGPVFIAIALTLMILGIITMSRMIKIKV